MIRVTVKLPEKAEWNYRKFDFCDSYHKFSGDGCEVLEIVHERNTIAAFKDWVLFEYMPEEEFCNRSDG